MRPHSIPFTLLRFGLRLILLLAFFAGVTAPVLAAATDRTEAFVYAISAFDGELYQSAFIPPVTTSIYFMANEPNILAARLSAIYYWPLTERYEADWLAENQPVEGMLEVRQGSQLVTTLQPIDYVIQYDAKDPVATRKLATGSDAQTAYAGFQKMQQDYRDHQAQYEVDMLDYRNKVSEIAANAKGKKLTEADFPPAPKEVIPFTLFSTEKARGFIINLPEGHYSVRLALSDGTIQPTSERKLEIFGKRRSGVSYKVIPHDRWTKPVNSQSPGGVIYTLKDTTLYLQPYLQNEYNEYAYNHMIDPQDTASRTDRNLWVSFNAYPGGTLVLNQTGKATEKTLESYSVVQSTGSGLGYTINIFQPTPGADASFSGYELALDEGQNAYQVVLKDAQGNLLPGSDRQIRVLNTQLAGWMYAASTLPLLLGAAVLIIRRRSVRKIKIEE